MNKNDTQFGYRRFARPGADFLLFFSVMFAPWWVSVLIALLLLVLYSPFYEILAAGLFMDVLYGANGATIFGLREAFSAGAVLLFIIEFFLRRYVAVYAKLWHF